MNPEATFLQDVTRRAFLGRSALGIGSLALASLLDSRLFADAPRTRARRVLHLFMSGGPSHLDLFDPKPALADRHGQEMPTSVRGEARFSANTARQGKLLLTQSPFRFGRHGQAGVEVSELLPHTARLVDEITVVRGMQTDSINHDPACTMLLTGALQPGRPSLGAWLSYGLGSLNRDLPEYVVLLSGSGGQPLRARYWGQGFLPSNHQGVQLRSGGDAVLHVANPDGITPDSRRRMLDALRGLNQRRQEVTGDPEIAARISSYEMAYRMQTSLPELADLRREPRCVLEMYGARPGEASFANNCLLARRLLERDVRFVQLFHRDWDHHARLRDGLRQQCAETDRPVAALLRDLKQRGLLEDTLVVWGGEFGRTPFALGKHDVGQFGRDHHAGCFSVWLAGGGVRRGAVVGQSDEFGFRVVEDPVHVHDLQATILHCLGIDHKRLTYRAQGREFRLTDVGGKIISKLVA